jgi:hypothetical protein
MPELICSTSPRCCIGPSLRIGEIMQHVPLFLRFSCAEQSSALSAGGRPRPRKPWPGNRVLRRSR